MDSKQNALLFSRSVIPFMRGVDRSEWPAKGSYFTHIGMYAFRSNVLKQITQLPQSSLELAESLEQLRWLQNGYNIKVGITDRQTIGIDTPADLEAARKLLASGAVL
jgi:3-deoxy-manno-octulosonate cytidylyltransferase (CMP-KDO synthetase)